MRNLIPSSCWILIPLDEVGLVLLTPVLVLLAFDLAGRFGWAEPLTAFALVLAVAHYLPGMMRAYGDRALNQQYRVRFLVAPLVLFAASVTFAYLDLHAVTLAMMLWGGWHWMMQSYGFGRIYDAKAKSVSAVTARLDRAAHRSRLHAYPLRGGQALVDKSPAQ